MTRTTDAVRKRPRKLAAALILFLSWFSLPAVRIARPKPEPRLSIGLLAGPFYPGQGNFRANYGSLLWPAELQLDWRLGQRLSLVAGGRYLETGGHTVLVAPVQAGESESYALRWRAATVRLGMNLSFGSSRFSPFVGAGGSATFFREEWLDAPLRSEGWKAGGFVQVGGRYRLGRRWHAVARLEYAAVPAGTGPRGRIDLGGVALFLGIAAGIF
jgi:hypothetical protein